MKLWDFQHHFQSLVLWDFEEGTAKLFAQNPSLLFRVYSPWWTKNKTNKNSNPAGQKSAPCRQNPKLRGLHRENCLSSNYLMLDILTPATSSSCTITIGVSLPCSSHGAKFPNRWAQIRCCAVSSSCTAADESRLDLPLSKSTREGGCCRSRGGLSLL